MIEEIKKEINEEKTFVEEIVINTEVIAIDKLFYILDKYNNQDLRCERTDCSGRIGNSKVFEQLINYKKVWEELQNIGTNIHFQIEHAEGFIEDTNLNKYMQELSKKYNLDKE